MRLSKDKIKEKIKTADVFLAGTGLQITTIVLFGSLVIFFTLAGLIHR